ncbi:MAG: phage major capsid protein [Pseudomonadota bacterium]
MTKLRELREKRARLVGGIRAIADKPDGDAGAPSEPQEKRFEVLKGELTLVEKSIEKQEMIDEADKRAAGQPIGREGDGDFEAECRAFSLTRAIAAASGLGVDNGREREVSAELQRRSGNRFQGIAVPMEVFQRRVTRRDLEKRVITTAAPAGGPGANIIATDFRGDQFIDVLRAKLVTTELGATVLSGLVGNVDVPRLKASAATGWVAENAAITPSDHQSDKVSLTPKHVGCITEFSRNMLLQTAPAIEGLIRDDFAKILAQALDAAAIKGGGSNEPDGVLSQAGLDTTVSMATPSWAKVLDLIDIVEEADAVGTGFLMRPLAAKKLRQTVRVASTDSRFVMEEPDKLADYMAVRSTLVPIDTVPTPYATSIIFGQWSDLLIGYWSAFDLLVNPYESTAYSKGNVSVRGMLTADIAVRHVESFAAATDFPAA